jgi:hypothetical protein
MSSKNKKTKKKAISMKPMDEFVPTYQRTQIIIVPPKTSNDIKPKEIFEGVKDNKPKKRPTKKGGKRMNKI